MNDSPRLLYIGDLPVESSYHGSALLYRLLQEYPSEKLMIVEANGRESIPERRLPGVAYRQYVHPGQRLQRTRFGIWANGWFAMRSGERARGVRRLMDGFAPQAILTLAHDLSWVAAAEIAGEEKLPLHLIVHDDPLSSCFLPRGFDGWKEKQFGRVYRQAASRLCVCPSMEQEYRGKYGVEGQVMYPSRAKDAPRFADAPKTYGKNGGPLVVAYAGHPGCRDMIVKLAACLEKSGGQLLLFGPAYSEEKRTPELNRPNIQLRGLVPSQELIARLREEADVVFVPIPFDSGSADFARLSFPSKLTDYTVTGLPLLIWGPDYCSAVRWAQQYGSIAEAVTSLECAVLERALGRLRDHEHRRQLGAASKDVGDRLFAHAVASETLRKVLQRRG
jgi:hypothetical protein